MMSEEPIEEAETVDKEADVEVEYDYIAMLQGNSEERAIAIYELERPSREAYIKKKRVAVEELVALGVSVESARLLANLYDHEV